MGKTVSFAGYTCTVVEGRYSNGRIALQLMDEEGPVAVGTVNVEDVEIPSDCVIVKNYSENEGMLEALQQAGIVGVVVRQIRTGFVTVPVCKYLGLEGS